MAPSTLSQQVRDTQCPRLILSTKLILLIGLFINNEFIPPKSGDTIETINPYDGSPIASVSAANSEDIDSAVAAARAAFKSPTWCDLPASDRGMLLYKLADICEREKHVLATIDAWDNGKPYQVALEEDIAEVVAVFRYYGGWADKVYGQTIETSKDKFAYTKHEPIGEWLVPSEITG